jgi:CubicO group peptidase (beta-lactamase class C family)
MRSRASPSTARGIATLAVVVALALAGGTAALLAVYPAEYLRRAVTLGDADVGDMAVFPSRPIPAGGAPWAFVDAKAPGRIEALAAGAGLGAPLPAFLESTGTLAFVVAKDERLLHEAYFGGQTRDAPVTSFSVAKSILSSLVGIAIAEGRIGSVDEPVTRWLPELATRDARFASITLRDLLDMSSGIRYVETRFLDGDDAKTYYWPDLASLALTATTIEGPPGRRFLYNNYHPLLLGLVLSRATGTTVSAYASEKLWRPLGAEADASWSLDAVEGLEKLESGFNARAIDFARLGRLWARRGERDGREVIPRAWLDDAARGSPYAQDPAWSAGLPFFDAEPGRGYARFFWVLPNPGGEPDLVAQGNHGQFVYVNRSRGVVIVRNGSRWGAPPATWYRLFRAIAAGA